jgi:hypothetical protein
MRGYFVVSQASSTARARLLAQRVRDGIVDPRHGARQVGLVPGPASDYHAGQYRRRITRVAVRCRLANGQWPMANGQWGVGRGAWGVGRGRGDLQLARC